MHSEHGLLEILYGLRELWRLLRDPANAWIDDRAPSMGAALLRDTLSVQRQDIFPSTRRPHPQPTQEHRRRTGVAHYLSNAERQRRIRRDKKLIG